jgi:Plasmid pRiA4b ORF-3-like protein
MAQVISGIFPKVLRDKSKKDDKPVASYVLHLSIAFSDPLIWRRLQVPGEFTLAQLHQVIQKAMGWSDGYIHQFLVGKICYEPTLNLPGPRESKRFDEKFYKLFTLEEDMHFLFTYLYGAGEGWEHQLHVEEVIPPASEPQHPLLLSGERACPPETVGDIHEYQKLLTAMETPGHKQQNRLHHLAGRPDFDPAFFDLEAAQRHLKEW